MTKAYGRRVVHDGLNLTIRRGERWCVMGKNGAGKSTLLKMVAGALAPDAGAVKLGASLKMGYFAQQALDLLDPDLTIEEQLRKDFPHESIGALKSLAGAFQFSGDETDKKIRALSGGEKTRLVMARMLLEPAELPRPRRADQPSRSGDQGDAARLAEDFDGTMLFVSHDRAFLRGLSNRVLELGGESGTEAQPHAYPGSYVEYVARTGHEAPHEKKRRLRFSALSLTHLIMMKRPVTVSRDRTSTTAPRDVMSCASKGDAWETQARV